MPDIFINASPMLLLLLKLGNFLPKYALDIVLSCF